MAEGPCPVTDGLEVGEVIGRGGASTVHRARYVATGAPVALKVLQVGGGAAGGGGAGGTPKPEVMARFRREFEIARELAHPHVVAVYEQGALPPAPGRPARPWMTMELIEGGSVTALVPAPDDPPDLPRVLAVLSQVAGALDHAHAHDASTATSSRPTSCCGPPTPSTPSSATSAPPSCWTASRPGAPAGSPALSWRALSSRRARGGGPSTSGGEQGVLLRGMGRTGSSYGG